jgi:hypothetical protein
MPTVPEFLRHDLTIGAPATVVLRSGVQLEGAVQAVDLIDDVLRIGGWSVRIEEVAGARAIPSPADTASGTQAATDTRAATDTQATHTGRGGGTDRGRAAPPVEARPAPVPAA